MSISFTIPGHPVAQGRPKFARMGKGVRAYDPKKSRDYKATVQAHAVVAVAGRKPIEGPVRLVLEAYFPCPRSDYRKRKPRLARWHTKRPDIDNVVKGIKDALSGVVWLDDSQVCRVECVKMIAAQGEAPRVTVQVDKCMPDHP